jgi:citrate/tricarballylate utilization protein
MTSVWRAIKDASTLRYLDGGGVGCMSDSDKPTDNRRMYHHFTFYGFMLCFSATSTATGYHYLLGMQAPYPWYDLPVVLGTLGGIGLIIGPIGLLRDKSKRDAAIQVKSNYGMDVAFLVMLLLTSITGLLLLILRSTPAMGVLLALHIGIVFSLFITMPYGKFVHGFYRFVALVRYAKERREHGLD